MVAGAVTASYKPLSTILHGPRFNLQPEVHYALAGALTVLMDRGQVHFPSLYESLCGAGYGVLGATVAGTFYALKLPIPWPKEVHEGLSHAPNLFALRAGA